MDGSPNPSGRSSIGHEEALEKFLEHVIRKCDGCSLKDLLYRGDETLEPLACYIHDIFKGVLVGGREKGDSRKGLENLRKLYERHDKVASRAEEAPELICIGPRVKNELGACILIPFSFSRAIYLRKADDSHEYKIERSGFEECFYNLSKQYLKGYIDSKYGEGTYDRLRRNIEETSIQKDDSEPLFDSIEFFPQRSWVSANDIPILAHMKGCMIHALGDQSLIIMNNPFYLENLKRLKDLEGLFAIQRIFLFYLNKALSEIAMCGFSHIAGELLTIDLNKRLDEYGREELQRIFNSPVIDYLTPFVMMADARSIVLVVNENLKNKIYSEILENAIKNTIDSIIRVSLKLFGIKDSLDSVLKETSAEAWMRIVELKPRSDEYEPGHICESESMCQEPIEEHMKEHEKQVRDARRLNSLLSLFGIAIGFEEAADSKILDRYERAIKKDIRILGFREGNSYCTSCRVRRAIERSPSVLELYRKIHVAEDEDLCNVCLAIRLAPFIVGRSSVIKKGDLFIEDPRARGQEIRGWRELFDPADDEKEIPRSLSLNDIVRGEGTDDVVFLVIRLEPRALLRKENRIKIDVNKFYEAQGLSRSKIPEPIRRIRCVTICPSIDRLFSMQIHFRLLTEQLLAKLYLESVRQLIILQPTTFTPMAITVIPVRYAEKTLRIITELLHQLGQSGQDTHDIKGSIYIYMIKAKPYTPIAHILALVSGPVSCVIDERDEARAFMVVPAIMGRNNIPLERLCISLKMLEEGLSKLDEYRKKLDSEELVEFFRSSARDLTYPAFRNYEKSPELEEKYVYRYLNSGKAPFSVSHEYIDIIAVYLARLLT